jgi:hypothetical protein
MSMMEPFMPHPDTEETVAAADAGQGAPTSAEGTGVAAEAEAAAERARSRGLDPLTHEPVETAQDPGVSGDEPTV